MPGSVKPRPTLSEIVAHKRDEVAARQQARPLDSFVAQAMPLSGFPFEAALRRPKPVHLIAEIKPSSPSAGVLQAELDLGGLLAAYNPYASAISVLTDAKYFGGSLERLATVTQQTPHPTLCKDFILEPYQVYEARLAGASAVLLIVKILDDLTLRTLHALIRALGMTPVVEIQNEGELARALAIDAETLLINNRDLSTFDISLETTHHIVQALQRESLSAAALANLLIISASGIESRVDIDFLLPSVQRFLIGSSLMKQPPDCLPDKLAELLGV
jgi:indole-3-glycerol phosphate synthase/phosphoribosylanthranilate isomerase